MASQEPMAVDAATAPRDEVPEEAIARRAYEMWQQRGCPLWEERLDWFAARAELDQERAMPQSGAEHGA